MLEGSDAHPLDPFPADDAVLVSRDVLERMQAEIKFKQTKIEALNFEIARLKRWRFGSSSESLDTTTQAVLFDRILADTALEDRAAEQETKPQPAASSPPKQRAVRQALPAKLPRIERHYEIDQTHCECGQAFKRIGEEVSEQLDCVPAQFFVLRHIRGKYACACCQTIQAAPMPAQIIDKGIPAAGVASRRNPATRSRHIPATWRGAEGRLEAPC
jgi:transposase